MNKDNSNNKWIEEFKKQVDSIQLEFDSFLVPGSFHDYYVLKEDEQTGTLFLDLCGEKHLPKQIADALAQAFMNAKPGNASE